MLALHRDCCTYLATHFLVYGLGTGESCVLFKDAGMTPALQPTNEARDDAYPRFTLVAVYQQRIVPLV